MAQAQGVYSIGSGTDRYDSAPDAIVTSAVLRVPQLLLEGATLARKGRWEGRHYAFGIQQNAQDLAPFRELLTAAQVQIVDQLRVKLILGEIDPST